MLIFFHLRSCIVRDIAEALTSVKLPLGIHTLVLINPVNLTVLFESSTRYIFSMELQLNVGVSEVCEEGRPSVSLYYFKGFSWLQSTGWLESGPGCCRKLVGDYANQLYVSSQVGSRYCNLPLRLNPYGLLANIFVLLTLLS